MELTGKQRRKLRALGHHLQVVVQVGQKGVTPEVVAAVEQALADHELVKVKISADAADEKEDRHAAAAAIAEQTGAAVAQVLGRTVLLYKQRKKNSKISV